MALLFGGLLLLVNPLSFRFMMDYCLGWYQATRWHPEAGEFFPFHLLELRADLLALFMPLLFLITLSLIAGIVIALIAKKDLSTQVLFRAGVAGSGFVFMLLLYLAQNQYFAGRFSLLRLVMVLMMGWLLLRTFYWGIIRNGRAGKILKNAGVALLGILVIFLLAEGVFLFVAKSNQNNLTLASKVWFGRYWELNEWGYRDLNTRQKLEAQQKKILLLGDSFTSGHGITDPESRFGDLLDGMLEGWRVINLGQNGSEPDDELIRLQEWEQGGDLLVLVWFVNDIHEAAASSWKSWEEYAEYPAPEEKWWRVSLNRGSYFWNYLASRYPARPAKSYREFLEEAYARQEVLEAHHQQLRAIIELAEAREIPTAVVLFPFIEDVEGSEFAIQPVREFLVADSIPVLDLRPVLLEKGPADGRVNPSDPHPNEAVHNLVAKELKEFLTNQGLLYYGPE